MAEEYDTSPLAWLKRVIETQEDEITCTECQDLVSKYVQVELEIGDAAAHIPQLAHHLEQCPACWETWQILLELAQLEAQRGLPDIQVLKEWLERDE